ncbi:MULTISPECIES: hypothetical protein [unclassified Pseudoalteromonas]|uniref:hypothetical protein n=1 Tax=unclassified Pseudoalteromonas TaxID=194690 RepID=UPI0005A6B59D|nr:MULTISPECIES: hypothetical protein [unclassified Pseudoalteromonas]
MDRTFFYIYIAAFIITVIGLLALFANMHAIGRSFSEIFIMCIIGAICYFLGVVTMLLKNQMKNI